MLGGALVATCVPEHYWLMFVWLYAGAIFSAYEAYWIGRILGPRLYDIRFFHHVVTPERVRKIGHVLEKWGVITFLIGRFVPFGARNGIFMTSGLSKMPFHRFIFRDGLGAFFATAVLFHLGHEFGEHYQILLHYFHAYEMIILTIALVFILSVGLVFWYRKMVFRI
jgi:membrane protein DedA with SNARE-associated domain